MAELDFYPIDVVYRTEKKPDKPDATGEAATENAPVIELYGRGITESQQLSHVKVKYWDFAPYFWVIPTGDSEGAAVQLQQMKADSPEYKVTATEVHAKNYLGREVKAVKIMLNVPAAVPSLREKAREFGLVLEADIPFTKRFLIDKRVMPLALYKADATIAAADSEDEKNRGLPSYEASKLSQISEEMPTLKILAIDIETHNPLGKTMLPEEHPIIMAALCGDSGFRKVLTWKKFQTQLEYIEFVNSEVELLEKLKHYIMQYEPDIITGYFSDVFDLPYIKSRADRYRIKFDIGLDGSQPKISKTAANTTTEITGIVHLDVFKFIRKVMWTSLQTTVYDLSSVAKELLNETKEAVDIDKLYIAWNNHDGSELESYCSYNMQDAQLTLNLCKKVLPNVMELTRTIGLPLYDVSRMSYSQLVEWYLIKQAREFNELAPNRPSSPEESRRRMTSYTGGFVYEPTPGLYKDIAVFDFMSLYPTIISAHNVSPDALNCSCCISSTQNKVPGEENIWFCTKRRGFIPTVIDEVIKRRIRVKEIIKATGNDKTLNARQMALKTIANSMYGYFGFFGA
ncbi:ribonuclease H-like domain-containing protein, partial [Candidatus Woesearchaeota archaeon]|nr:ribonuclease H-like domain-containing protein [Candidatus Woesearchaeota archaeon]